MQRRTFDAILPDPDIVSVGNDIVTLLKKSPGEKAGLRSLVMSTSCNIRFRNYFEERLAAIDRMIKARTSDE